MNQPTEGVTAAVKTAPVAIWSLVLGILGIIPLGILAAIPAVICGHIAIPKIGQSNGSLTGRGLAIAGLALGYISIAVSIVFMLFAILLPSVSQARGRAQRVKCMSNLAMIGKSCMVYALDHDDIYPPNFKAIANDYKTHPKIFVSPATGNVPGNISSVDEWSDYVLVPNRDGSASPNNILAFSKPECYPGEGGTIVTISGAVRWCKLKEYDELTAEFRR